MRNHYLCGIKITRSIVLIFLFLLSTTGIRASFAYCCGQIESFSVFDQEVMNHACCEMPEETGCCDEDQLDQDMSLQDMAPLKDQQSQKVTSVLLPQRSTPWLGEEVQQGTHLKIPDPRLSVGSLHIQFQQFRC